MSTDIELHVFTIIMKIETGIIHCIAIQCIKLTVSEDAYDVHTHYYWCLSNKEDFRRS